MGSQQFCLRWNNHQMNMLNVFESLLQNEVLVDVTLACDGLTLKAHKVVLSACSPYFQSLFMDNPCKHPIVFLKDVRYCDLKALIDFMYKGEVNVGQDQLNALLTTAESLKIKGLAEMTGGNGSASCTTNSNSETQIHPTNRSQTSSSGNGTSGEGLALSPHHSVTAVPVESNSKRSAVTSLLQSSSSMNASSIRGYGGPSGCSSPPPKRRKTKPRKRIPESALMCSDQEDSDALDLATTTPEIIETCVDLPPTDNTLSETSETNVEDVKPNISILEMANQSHLHSYQYEPLQIGEENHPSPENKQSYSSNQNQFSLSVPKPPNVPSQQRLGALLPKPSLLSVIPSSAVSPLPSTSTPEATIQDIRRLCHFTRQSQKHKSPWTEDDMVAALEAVQRGRLTYALAARKFDIPKATLHYYVILMKAVEAVRSGRMTQEIAAIKYNVRNSVLNGCLYGVSGEQTSRNSSPPPQQLPMQPLMLALERNDVARRD